MDGNTLEVELWLDSGLAQVYCPEVLTREDIDDLRELFRQVLLRVKLKKLRRGRSPGSSDIFRRIKEYLRTTEKATDEELAASIGVPAGAVRMTVSRNREHFDRIKEPGKKVVFRLKDTA